MPDGKLKIYKATWEDFGGTTPLPDFNDLLTQNIKGEAWLHQTKKPYTLEEKFGKIPTTIQGFEQPENISFKTPEDMAMDELKARNLPFTTRAIAKITDFLLKNNLHNTSGGDVIKEIGTPIVSGLMRTQESMQKNPNILQNPEAMLGTASTLFGTLMSPFSAIKMGTEKVGGETAGKVAEVGSLAFTGGIPLVVGYLTSQGATELAKKVSEGLELTPKESETVQEVAGLTAFILGDKSARSFGKKINTSLGVKVKSWIDEAVPDQMSNSVFRKGEGETVPEGTYRDLLKGQDQQRIINNPPEKRAYQEPTQELNVPTEIITNEGTPTKPIFSYDQIRERINEIDKEVRKAELEGNESLFNELQSEKQRWTQQLEDNNATQKGNIQENNVEQYSGTNKIGQTPETSGSNSLFDQTQTKRQKAEITTYEENKKAIESILDENKGLLTERQIRSKLTSLVEEGKLKKAISTESIKKIKDEWKQRQPKPKVQEIKSTPNELGLKIPNENNTKTVFSYDKNAPVTLKEYIEKNPDVLEKVKDLKTFEEVQNAVLSDWNQKREGVLSGKKSQGEGITNLDQEKPLVKEEVKTETNINKPAKDLLDKTTKEPETGSMWDELFSKRRSTEEIKRDIEKANREGFNNVGSVLGAVNTKAMKLYYELALNKFEEGAKDFGNWSEQMLKDAGENIRPHLRKIYDELKVNAKINDQPVKDWINKYKDNLKLELKPIDGKIIDPNTGQEGAARHKAGREKSTIEYNDNTQGSTWYHELAHVINNKIRQIDPKFLEEFKPEIDKLAPSNKPLNEKFADAFERIYTDPSVPRTRLAKVLEQQFSDLPKSFELARRTNKELGFEKLPERESGIREEKSLDWLEQKYDAPKETINEVESARNTKLYQELRDDGTQTFQEALKESARLQDITEAKLLELDPKTLNGKVFNKAQQVKIDQIAINKALQVGELRKTFGEKLGTDQAKILEKEILNLVKLQALAKNNLREAARVMESARKRNRLSPEEYELIDKIAGEIDKANKNTNLTERVKGIEDATNPTLKDKAMYWWYNSILSNPLTDLANIGGNLSNLAWEVVTQPKSIIDGSFFTGIKLGWENAKRVWDGQQQAISKYTDLSGKYSEILKTKTKTGTRIKNTLLPTERLKIEDAFFRSIFENIREQQQAKRTAKEFKTTAKEVIDIYTQILEGKDPQSILVTENGLARFEKEVKSIEDYANKMVFQKELGQAGKLAQSLLNTKPMLPVKMLALPFLRIAVNLTKMSLESSPVGLLKPLLKRAEYKDLTKLEKQDIYRRALAGTVILSGIASLVSTGEIEITGEAPADPRIRELWEKAGYKSNSIVINNSDGTKTLIAYPNVSPFNITLGAVGTLMTEMKYDKPKEEGSGWLDNATDKALNSVLSMVRVLGNQSFLQGTSQLLTTIEKGDAKNIKQQIIRMGTPNLFSLFEGNADFGEGRKLYETEGILDQVKERLGITGDLKPKVDAYGEDRLSTYRRFPIPRQEKVDKIAEFLLRTGNVIGTPSNPKLQGKETLSQDEYRVFVKEYKQNMHKALNRTFDLLQKLESQGEVGSMTIDRLMSALKQESRELAKIKAKHQ